MRRRLVSYLILICFGLLISPKDWYHDCDHSDLVEHHDGGDNDCDFCHFDIDAALVPLTIHFKFKKVENAEYYQAYVSAFEDSFENLNDLRGPPSLLIV